MDRLAAVVLKLDRRRLAVFPDGWGEGPGLELFGRLDRVEVEPAALEWGRKEEHPGYRIRRARFTSPIASLLPFEARVVDAELIEPGPGSDRLCILFPSWNDHGWADRRRLAVFLSQHRIACLYFHPPFYGSRRVVPEPLQAVRTVADFGILGYGAVAEALALAAAFPEHRLGFSGFSMGGTLAALAAALYPRRAAIAPLAGAYSPAPVYLDGLLRHGISWKALGGTGQRRRLRELLGRVSVLDLPVRPWHRDAVLVGARRDRFVPPDAVERLARHWKGCELRWVDTDHAGLARRREELARHIVDAFRKWS